MNISETINIHTITEMYDEQTLTDRTPQLRNVELDRKEDLGINHQNSG